MTANVVFAPTFIQRRFAVDAVTHTPIYLTDYHAFEVSIKNSDPLVGWYVYTDTADEDTKEYMYPGTVKVFKDLIKFHTPAPFPKGVPRLWVIADSGVGPMETTWRVVKDYTS